jgi:DNA-binding protein H-NS
MWTDEIVEEIHRIREEYAKSFNYDLDAIFADLRKKEAESGREVVNLSRKPGLTTRWSGRGRDISGDAEDTSRRST